MERKDLQRILKRKTKKADALMERYYKEMIEPDLSFRHVYKGYGYGTYGDYITVSILDKDAIERLKTSRARGNFQIIGNSYGYVYSYIDIEGILNYANSIGL